MTNPTTAGRFLADLRSLGVGPGDLLLTHSRMGGGPPGEVPALLEALLASVEPGGTAAFPTFNFGFCRGEPYDAGRTPSEMGLLSELARRDPRARRILHPVYSFALFGAGAAALAGRVRNSSAYGDDSLFGELRRRNGKILILDLRWSNSMTFFHHVEELCGCDYRFMKTFTGEVRGLSGGASRGACAIYVRDLEAGVVTDIEPAGRLIEEAGLVRSGTIGGRPARLMEAGKVFEALKGLPRSRPELFRRIEKPAG